MQHATSSIFNLLKRPVLVLLLLAAGFLTRPVSAQVSCNSAISDAQSAYFNANFTAAIQILTFCIDQAIFDPFEEKEAYLLLSRVYFSVGQQENAEAAMEKVFELDSLYVADPAFPPPLKELVDSVRTRMDEEGRLGTNTLAELPPDETQDPTLTENDPTFPETDQDLEAQRRRRNLIFIGGGAAAAVGTLAILLSGGDGGGGGPDPTGFPLPPGRP